MSQQPDENKRSSSSPQDDFESGLDYGAFAGSDADFPEDHLDQDELDSDQPHAERPSAATEDPEANGQDNVASQPPQPVTGQRENSAPAEEATQGIPGQSGQQWDQPTQQWDASSTRSLREELAATENTGEVSTGYSRAFDPSTSEVASNGTANAAAGTAAADDRTRSLDADQQPTTVITGGAAGAQQNTTVPVAVPAVDTDSTDSDATQTLPAQGGAVGATPQPVNAQSGYPQPGHTQDEPTDGTQAMPAYRDSARPTRAGQAKHAAADEYITDADIDEEVRRSKRAVSRFFTVLITIFTPLVFIVAAVRVVASPLFLAITYYRPGFPGDAQWSTDERLLYGSYGVDFLLNGADSRYLAGVTVDGGDPLFSADEISHMADVKWVMLWVMIAGAALLVLVLLLAWMLRHWRPGGMARGVFAGAWVSLALVIAAVVFAVLDWQRLFVQFHEVFFPQGNWEFSAESSLIRLYPAQFWVDAGIWIGSIVVLISVVSLLLTWPTKKRRARRAERLEAVQLRRREKLVAELNSAS